MAQSDIESAFEEELAVASGGKQGGGWSLGKKVAFGIGAFTAVVLVIAIPIVLTKDGGNSSMVASTGIDDVSTNVGVGSDGRATAAPVDVVTEDPFDSVIPLDMEEKETETVTPPTQEEEANIPETAAVPETFAPVSTETACSLVNTTNTTSWVAITPAIFGELANDLSGRNIAMSADGSILAIAADLNSGKAQRSGHVRVYRYASGEYTQLGQDLDGEAEFDWFGTSLALDASGLRLAVGGRFNDGKHGNDTGHVRLFDFSESSGNWKQVGEDLEGKAPGDQFGRTVALSADGARLAVGASNADETVNITDVGHVYLYEISDDSFTPIGQFKGDSEKDLSGNSISLSEDGTHVAIAAAFHDAPNGMPDIGQIKVYSYDSSSKVWSKVGLNIEGKAPGTRAGLTVALSTDGSRVAVSYPQNIMGIPAPGITQIYELQDGLWVKLGGNDLIGGHSVSISRNGRVAVGDYLGFSAGLNSGFVHVYEFNNEANAWDLVGQVINGIQGEMSGTSVAISADGLRVAVSAPRVSPDGSEDVGAVRVYDLCG